MVRFQLKIAIWFPQILVSFIPYQTRFCRLNRKGHNTSRGLTSTFISPEIVVRFLISREPFGRTQVHVSLCTFLGQHGIKQCGCKVTMAWTSVDSLIGRLSRGFNQMQVTAEWDNRLAVGNPVKSFPVRKFLKFVTAEQCESHVTPKQAVIMFSPEFLDLIAYMLSLLHTRSVPIHSLILRMDIAFLAIAMSVGRRGADISQLDCQMTRRLPGDICRGRKNP
eukprot:Lithocolla_globosa_v1_NODE_3420_length_1676_cov_2.118445.p1 type:complete len:222 gc:universal NODE_3420_length_1676_cov_2.118445:1223-558(-)